MSKMIRVSRDSWPQRKEAFPQVRRLLQVRASRESANIQAKLDRQAEGFEGTPKEQSKARKLISNRKAKNAAAGRKRRAQNQP